MTKTIFSDSVSISERNQLLSAIESTFVLFDNIDQLMTSLSSAEKKIFHDHIQSMDSIIYRVVEQRRANELEHKDTLAVLIKVQGSNGELLSNQQIRDEIVALLRSGHKNNATTLAWVFYLLARHPQARLQLEMELAEALEDRPPTKEDLPKLGYAQMVIKEAMRLYPLYPLINRYAVQDCELGKYHVPSGTRLTISQWDLHRSPRYFDHPEEFNPGRWKGDLDTNLPKFVYLPFSAGARRCPFKSYAMMEMTLILAMIVQQFRIELLPHSSVKPQFSPNGLYPKDGLPVVVHKRP
jgi:cytochrome P450